MRNILFPVLFLALALAAVPALQAVAASVARIAHGAA